jgi:hypothetical protein
MMWHFECDQTLGSWTLVQTLLQDEMLKLVLGNYITHHFSFKVGCRYK